MMISVGEKGDFATTPHLLLHWRTESCHWVVRLRSCRRMHSLQTLRRQSMCRVSYLLFLLHRHHSCCHAITNITPCITSINHSLLILLLGLRLSHSELAGLSRWVEAIDYRLLLLLLIDVLRSSELLLSISGDIILVLRRWLGWHCYGIDSKIWIWDAVKFDLICWRVNFCDRVPVLVSALLNLLVLGHGGGFERCRVWIVTTTLWHALDHRSTAQFVLQDWWLLLLFFKTVGFLLLLLLHTIKLTVKLFNLFLKSQVALSLRLELIFEICDNKFNLLSLIVFVLEKFP